MPIAMAESKGSVILGAQILFEKNGAKSKSF